MKKVKVVLITFAIMQSFFVFAQNYSFIPKDLHKMNDEEMIKYNVQFGALLPMFDENGNDIDANQINDIMISGNFIPVVYGNKLHEAKTIVFRKATKKEKEELRNKMDLAMQNPNANFKPGEIAKNFTTTYLNGEKVTLNDLKGKIVVLNFWFIQCHPCVEEIPALNKIVSKYDKEEVEFIAITFDKLSDLNKFFKTHQFDYNIVSDGSVVQKYKVNTFPLHIIIDKKGEIIFKKTGAYLKELEAKIDLLLKE